MANLIPAGGEFTIGAHANSVAMRSADEAGLLGETEIVCIGCGCTDEQGCEPDAKGMSCHWVTLDEDARAGLCSRCAAKPIEELLARVERQ